MRCLKIVVFTFFLFVSSFLTFSYEVILPDSTANVHTEPVLVAQNEKDEEDIFYVKILKIVVKYGWILTGVVAFGVVIYAGFNLLTSQGDEQELDKANKTLVWGLVGIFVSLLSYVLIKALIHLF